MAIHDRPKTNVRFIDGFPFRDTDDEPREPEEMPVHMSPAIRRFKAAAKRGEGVSTESDRARRNLLP